MKKVLIVSFCILFALTSFAMARPAANGTTSQTSIQQYNSSNDRPLDGLFSSAVIDTYVVAEYDFDVLGVCDAEGWTAYDGTAQPGVMFHVDDYRVITGTQSLWCGHRADAVNSPWCSYAVLPGYGNNWNQYFTSVPFAVSGNVTFGFHARYDSEPGYDYSYVEYVDTSFGWVNLYTFTYVDPDTLCSTVINSGVLPGTAQFRFRFASDGAWSDEDGLWNTQGAIIVDDITVDDGLGSVDSQTFETEALQATSTSDGDWNGTMGAGYGDFSGLFPGLNVVQLDNCSRDITCLWGFFKNSTENYQCGGHAEQLAVPKHNALGQYINNEVWSPWLDLTVGGSVPASATDAVLEFYVYRDLPLDNLVFYVWHVRSRTGAGACPSNWKDRNFVYYGPGTDWLHIYQGVGDLMVTGATEVQIALGVMDLCVWWCGYYGTGNCHSDSPLFDRVRFFKTTKSGPVFSVRDIDLFQDSFPSDGTTTGTVRIDMAIDRMPTSSPNIYPGDSAVITVSEPTAGLGTGGVGGRADVYCYVRSSGGQTGQAMSDDASRYTLIGGPTAGGFYQFQCDTSYQDVAMTNPTPDKFCFDLNDNLYVPGNRIDFYFSATDANTPSNTNYWSQGTGTTTVQADCETYPMEVQCLPTGNSDILYVDDFSGRGAQPYFDTAFQLMGITPDRYDVRGPTSEVANGPGARAVPGQVTNVYHKIIWNSGDLSTGTIGDGSGSPEKSKDMQLLVNFLDQSSIWNPGLYISGDDIAEEMQTQGTFATLFAFISYNLTNGDHIAEGAATAPLVVGLPPATIFQHAGPPVVIDTLVAFGGCPIINDFDVLEPTGTAVTQMYYADLNPVTGAAVISQETVNAVTKTARVVLESFSYHYIRDDQVAYPNDRVDHLTHIIRWFENTINLSTGNGHARLSNSLSQNYPNPFNPRTTIKFSIKERAHVSLKIYNVAGQLVKTLKNKVMGPNSYTETWRGLDNSNRPVASGVYFYKLVTKNFSQSKKMVYLK